MPKKEITLKPLWKQHLAYEALKDKKFVFLGGGAGGGKSWFLCESRLVNCYRYPGYKSFIGREELKRLMQSTYVTWQKVCAHHEIPEQDWKFNGQYNYIEFFNGSRIDLLDLKMLPSDVLYERFGSLEYSDGAIEEAGEVHFSAYDVLKTRIGRHLNKELEINPSLAITGNPKKNWTYQEFYKPWKNKTLPEDHAFIQSLYGDNEYIATEYGAQLAGIKDKATKQRLMFGNWEYEDDPRILINYDASVDLFTNTLEESGQRFLTADLARFGSDKVVVMLWKGWQVYAVHIWQKESLEVTTKRIRELLTQHRIPYSCALADEDGVGGGVVDSLKGIKGFINNSSPLKPPKTNLALKFKKDFVNYGNLRSQCWFEIAEDVNSHRIAIDWQNLQFNSYNTDLTQESWRQEFIEELGIIKSKDVDKELKLRVIPKVSKEGKESMKDLLGRSPDSGDAFMMRKYFDLIGMEHDEVTATQRREKVKKQRVKAFQYV